LPRARGPGLPGLRRARPVGGGAEGGQPLRGPPAPLPLPLGFDPQLSGPLVLLALEAGRFRFARAGLRWRRTKPPPPCKYGPPAHPEGADQRLDRLGSDSPDQRSSHQDATPATALERVARRPLERASSPPGHPAQAIAVDAPYAIPDLHRRRSVASHEFRRWQGHVL